MQNEYGPRKLKRGIRTHFCRNVIAMEIRHLGLSLMEGELLYFRHSSVRVQHFATKIPGKFAYLIRASRTSRWWKRRQGENAHVVYAWDQDLRDLTSSGVVYEKIRKYNNSAPWATTKWRRVRIPLFNFLGMDSKGVYSKMMSNNHILLYNTTAVLNDCYDKNKIHTWNV